MSNEPITSFSGEFRWLSNFPDCCKIYLPDSPNISYRSVEHAYQAAKTFIPEERKLIREAPTAALAKRLGKTVTKRDDWDEVKLSIMEHCLRQKFNLTQTNGLGVQLVSTGQRQLVEGNTWGDMFWGVCRGKGHNHLGKLLMQIRADLRKDLGLDPQ